MRVSRIEIWNIKGIEQIVIEAGSVTVLSGSNETGKSSVLDAIRCVFEGGHQPELIRRGTEKGECKITLDNGTTLHRTITGKTSSLKITTADGAAVAKPETWVKSLASSFAFDPMAFLEGKTKEQRDRRLKFVLEALPIVFTRAEVEEAAGSQARQAEYTLDEFQAFRDGRYTRRRELNKELDDLRGTRRTIASVLPEGELIRVAHSSSTGAMPEPAAKVNVKNIELDLKAAESERTEMIRIMRDTYLGVKDDISVAEAAEIDVIRQEMETRIQAVRDRKNEERRQLEADYSEGLATARKPYDDKVSDLTAQLAQAKDRAEQESKLQGVRESIAKIDEQIAGKEAEALSLDDAVKALDDLRRRKLDSLPIEGVEVRSGEIFYNGLPFDELNTQNKIFLACQIGALKFGGLPLMICDQIEQIDDIRWQAFCEGVKDAGFQVIAARVDVQLDATGNPVDMPLTVTAA